MYDGSVYCCGDRMFPGVRYLCLGPGECLPGQSYPGVNRSMKDDSDFLCFNTKTCVEGNLALIGIIAVFYGLFGSMF